MILIDCVGMLRWKGRESGARGAKVVKDRIGCGGVVIIEGISQLEF